MSYVFFPADVTGDSDSLDLLGNGLCAIFIQIGDNHRLCAFPAKPLAQCPADAAGTTCHNNNFPRNFHESPSPEVI